VADGEACSLLVADGAQHPPVESRERGFLGCSESHLIKGDGGISGERGERQIPLHRHEEHGATEKERLS
jgi:hypothetical protein